MSSTYKEVAREILEWNGTIFRGDLLIQNMIKDGQAGQQNIFGVHMGLSCGRL